MDDLSRVPAKFHLDLISRHGRFHDFREPRYSFFNCLISIPLEVVYGGFSRYISGNSRFRNHRNNVCSAAGWLRFINQEASKFPPRFFRFRKSFGQPLDFRLFVEMFWLRGTTRRYRNYYIVTAWCTLASSFVSVSQPHRVVHRCPKFVAELSSVRFETIPTHSGEGSS